MEELVKLATDIINRDYFDDVRGITQDLIRQIKEGEITTREELDDRLHQDIDGSGRIIYTWSARLGLLATDNVDAYEEEMGEKPAGPEQQLFMAMRRDVEAQLESEDVDDLLRKARNGEDDED